MRTPTLIFVAIAVLISFATATPPACLLAAVMEQPNPADLKALCGSLIPQLAANITASCSGAVQTSAISNYSATCLAHGSTITVPSASSTATGPSASTSAITTSGSGSSSSTTSSSASASTTKSGASSISAYSMVFMVPLTLGGILASQFLL